MANWFHTDILCVPAKTRRHEIKVCCRTACFGNTCVKAGNLGGMLARHSVNSIVLDLDCLVYNEINTIFPISVLVGSLESLKSTEKTNTKIQVKGVRKGKGA